MKSGLKIGTKKFKTNSDIISWFTNGCNNINANTQEVYIMNCPNDRGKTNIPITSNNFYKVVSLFSARKLIMPNWINSKDEYLAPDESNPDFEEFVNDSVIFSLFHSASN